MKYLLPFILLISIGARAQLQRYDNFAATTTSASGIGNIVQVIPNATLTVFNQPAVGVSCSGGGCTAAITYTSRAGTATCGAGVPLTRPTANTCIATADNTGNFGFWALAGQYQYCIAAVAITTQCYNVNVGIPAIQFANNFTGTDLGAQIQNADTACGVGVACQIHVTASGNVSTQVTISSNHDLICDGDQVTLSFTNSTANITQSSNTRIRNCAISSTQTVAPTNTGEVNAAGVSNIQIENVTFTGGGAHIFYNGVSGFLIKNTRHVSVTAVSVSVINVTNSVKGKITLSRVESFIMPTSAVFLPIIDFQGLSAGACDRIDAVANTVDGVDATTVQGSAAIAFNGCSNVNIIGGSYSNNNNMDGVLVNGSGNGLVPSSNVNVVGVTATNNSNVAGSGSNAHNGDGLDVFNADKVNITGGDFGNNGNLSTNRNNCMDDYNNTNVTITGGGNYSDCGNQGIQIASAPRTRVTGAYIDRNREDGVALQQTASMTCNTVGTAVTLATGPGFGLGWILGTLMVINNVTYYIQSVNSTTSITLQSTAGTQNGVTCFVDSYDEVIDGNEIVDNGIGALGGSLQQGVQAVGSASGIVVNNVITDTRSSGKTQLYGIRTDNTASLNIGNNLMFLNGSGNATGAILDNANVSSYFNQVKDTSNNTYYQPGGPGNTSIFLDAGTVVGEIQIGVNHAADIVAAVPLKIKEVAAPSGVAGFEMCYGDSTLHGLKCSMNGTNFHPVPPIERSTCTMAAGTCTFTFAATFTSTPICTGTWNGTGTFTTGASLKVAPSTSNAVATSSTGTDTAVIQIICAGNPN